MSAEEEKDAHESGVHQLKDLAALIAVNIYDGESHEHQGLMISVWRDCGFTVKLPDGSKMSFDPTHTRDLDTVIHRDLIAYIHLVCQGMCVEILKISVHEVPPELTTDEEIFTWLQPLPGVTLTILPPEDVGFGGPVPPSGQAG